MNTKLKKGVDLFNSVWDSCGVSTDPNEIQDLHKIKTEWNPLLTFVEKLGGNCPLNSTVQQKDGTYGKFHAEQLRTCFDMLKGGCVYPGHNLAPLKELYPANWWTTKPVSTSTKNTKDVQESIV